MTATPASHPFEIREHDTDGVHVIAMRGEFDLATAPRLAVRIDTARRNRHRRMVIAAHEESAVGRMFALAGAHEVLPVYEDAESALAALAPRPR